MQVSGIPLKLGLYLERPQMSNHLHCALHCALRLIHDGTHQLH